MTEQVDTEKQQWPDISRLYEKSAIADQSLLGTRSVFDGSVVSGESFPPEALSNNPSSYYTSYSYGGSSATTATNSEEEAISDNEEDVDDDEILSWVASGMLPVNASTTLALNQAYQEIMEQFMGRCEASLAQIRERQRTVQTSMNQNCAGGDKGRRHLKIPTALYVCPYFRDSAGMCPGLNQEAEKRRKEAGNLDMLIEPRFKWSANERTALLRGIAATSKEGQIDPLLRKRENLKEKSDSDEASVSDIKQYVIEIEKIDKQLSRITRKEENDILSAMPVTAEGIDWNLISVKYMDGIRTATECKLAWKNKLVSTDSAENKTKAWSKEELASLKKIATSKRLRNWPKIALLLGTGRTAFECAETYQTELNDNLIKKDWTYEDDEQLLEAIEQVRIGDFIPWEQIPVFLDGRTRIDCQRHYNKCLNPKLKRGRWSEDEDMRLMQALDKYGEKNWSKISHCVGSRSDVQCRERWCMALNERVKIDPWLRREDATLLLGASTFGVGSWANIARLLPGRTASACKQRYKSLKRTSKSRIKGDDPTKININLGEDLEPIDYKKQRTRLRSIFFSKRKERVRRWFEVKHGRSPLVPPMMDVADFLETLPPSTRQIIHDKLILIQKIYGKKDAKTLKKPENEENRVIRRNHVIRTNNTKEKRAKKPRPKKERPVGRTMRTRSTSSLMKTADENGCENATKILIHPD